MAEPETTTIEVKTDVWAALDRRKNRGESFNDVVERLINASPAGVGELEGPHPDIETQDLEELSQGEVPNKGCAHFDVVSGEECTNDPEYKQKYRYSENEDWSHFYYCEEHAPE